MIMNDQRIDPMPVITGAAQYPKGISGQLEASQIEFISCSAFALAEQAGSVKTVNVALIGLLARHMEFPRQDWEAAIDEIVPEKFRAMNLAAFGLGYNFNA
jgi:indolepyruvate ferredoxin oxidoreductase beta subunit